MPCRRPRCQRRLKARSRFGPTSAYASDHLRQWLFPARSLPPPGRSPMLSLSVVIPVYRQLRCLDMTLGSLATQIPSPGEFEVIVVDDGSGDDTAAVVGKHKAWLPVRLVQHSVNRGRAAARNSGAAVA